MPRMLDVSDDVRAEIGDAEADRLLAGENAPGPLRLHLLPHPRRHLAGAHQHRALRRRRDRRARLRPRHLHPLAGRPGLRGAAPGRRPQHHRRDRHRRAPPWPPTAAVREHRPGAPRQAVLGITCGLVLCEDNLHPALVVEPTGPIGRPRQHGGRRVPAACSASRASTRSDRPGAPRRRGCPAGRCCWRWASCTPCSSAAPAAGTPTAWWQAHQPLPVSDGWRSAANRTQRGLRLRGPGRHDRPPAARGPAAGRAGPGRRRAACWSAARDAARRHLTVHVAREAPGSRHPGRRRFAVRAAESPRRLASLVSWSFRPCGPHPGALRDRWHIRAHLRRLLPRPVPAPDPADARAARIPSRGIVHPDLRRAVLRVPPVRSARCPVTGAARSIAPVRGADPELARAQPRPPHHRRPGHQYGSGRHRDASSRPRCRRDRPAVRRRPARDDRTCRGL